MNKVIAIVLWAGLLAVPALAGPPNWDSLAATGKQHIIAVPLAINPTIGGVSLQAGDYVGVFYDSMATGVMKCGGFKRWTGTGNIAVTARGDFDGVSPQIGFFESQAMAWRMWDSSAAMDYWASASYASGPVVYTTGSTSTLASLTATLPSAIDMSEFSCLSGSQGIDLTWQTASENNNYEWMVERSYSPAGNYQTITTIKAEAGSPDGKRYSYTDNTVLPNSVYYYRLGDKDLSGQITWHGPVMAASGGLIPAKLQLMPCLPNPASNEVTFSYVLPRSGQVLLNVYDICGRRVNTLAQGNKPGGAYNLTWNGNDSQGRKTSSGVYYYRLEYEGVSLTRQLVLLK